jgi:hypothetical protein
VTVDQLREAMLKGLKAAGVKSPVGNEDLKPEVIKARLAALPTDEAQILVDRSATETGNLIEKLLEGMGKTDAGLMALLGLLDLLPFSEERFNAAFDRMYWVALSILVKESKDR